MTASQASHVSWLAEFLSPWFGVACETEAPADVTLTFGMLPAGEWAVVRGHTERPGPTEVGCFVLDGRVTRHPAWRERDGGWSMLDRELDAIYRVAPGRAAVEVVAGGSEQAGRVALRRAVRELAAGAAVRSGALPLHAAALTRAGRALLLAGPKRAGKTTLLLRTLAAPDVTFIANDRVLAWTGDDPIARGMPSIVSVRSEVLASLPTLRSRLQHAGYHHAVTLAEARAGQTWRRADGAGDLTPAQLCDLLDVTATAEAPLSAVVFPSAAEGAGRPCLEPLSARDALPRLREAVFGDRRILVSEIFGGESLDGADDPAAADAHCRKLLTRVPAFACRFDPGALEPADGAALVDAALR